MCFHLYNSTIERLCLAIRLFQRGAECHILASVIETSLSRYANDEKGSILCTLEIMKQ